MNNQNHHQSTSSRTPECVSIGPLLALLDDEMLAPRDAARVRAHLSGCAACRAQRHAYSQLDIALRRHFGPAAFPPLRMEDIVEDLSREHISIELLEASPLASMSQPPTSRQPRRILSGVASLAAVLVIALLATFIFANHPHPGTSSVSGSHTFSQTSLTGISMVSPDEGWMVGSSTTFTTKNGPTPSSTVTSSTPGVSTGSSSSAVLSGPEGTGTALLYHYKNGTWTPYTITPHIPGIAHLTSISMDSPTDGWAVGGTLDGPSFDLSTAKALLLHYDGTAWRQVASSINAALGSVYMLSPTNGWALTEGMMGIGQQTPEILHYNGSAWSSQPLPASLLANASGVINFTGFSALPSGDAWAAAVLFPIGKSVASSGSASGKNGTSASSSPAPGQSAPGQPALPSSVILHYVNGVWAVQSTFANAIVNAVAMASSDDGWAAGQDLPDIGASSVQKSQQPSTLLLRYSGGQWRRAVSPPTGANGASRMLLTHLVAFSPSDVWILGMSEKTASGLAAQGSQGSRSGTLLFLPKGSLALLHYDGARWTSVAGPSFPPNTMPSLTDGAFTSPSSGWAVGSLLTLPNNPPGSSAEPQMPQVTPLVLHYLDGAWGVYKLP